MNHELPNEIKEFLSLLTKNEIQNKFELAIVKNQVNLIKYLLDNNDMPYQPQIEYGHLADIETISLEVFKVLNKHYQKNNEENFQGLIYKIIENDRLDLLDYILTSDDIKIKLNINKLKKDYLKTTETSPLSYACEKGHLKIVEYLLSSPNLTQYADIDDNGNYPLYCAIKNNHKEIINFLLTSKKIKEHADINKDKRDVIYELSQNYSIFPHLKNKIEETLTFLIIECNIKFNQEKKEIIKTIPEIEKLYQLKELKEHMENNMQKTDIIAKIKHKI